MNFLFTFKVTDVDFLQVIEIENCGEFSKDEPWNLEENDGTEDTYPQYPEDCNMETLENSQMDKVIDNIKNSGNYYYNKNNFTDSDRKYSKCLRYIEWYISKNKIKDNYLHDQWIHASTNLAAAKLKRQKYMEVVRICSEVGFIDIKLGNRCPEKIFPFHSYWWWI